MGVWGQQFAGKGGQGQHGRGEKEAGLGEGGDRTPDSQWVDQLSRVATMPLGPCTASVPAPGLVTRENSESVPGWPVTDTGD